MRGIAERAGALFEVAAQAEGHEPEVAAAAQAGRAATTELCRSIWDRAASDGLLPGAVDRAQPGEHHRLLICADTVVHLRRAGTWSAPAYRSLIVDTLTLSRPPT